MTLHLRFDNLPDTLIEATETLVVARPHSLPDTERDEAITAWLTAATGDTIAVPGLSINPDYDHARYDHANGTITLDRFTLYELFHQYRHHQQWQGTEMIVPTAAERSLQIPRHEIDAHAWACSLFYRVLPDRFIRLANADRIPGLSPIDIFEPGTHVEV